MAIYQNATMRWPYEELPTDVYEAGWKLLQAWGNETEDLNPNQLMHLESWYQDWRNILIEQGAAGHIIINHDDPRLWYRTQNREEMDKRGFRLRTLRHVPACLITEHTRLALMRRAANGEEVWASWGEKSSARHVSIVEGDRASGHYDTLWAGSEADWRAEMCNPITWPLCRTICRRTPRDY